MMNGMEAGQRGCCRQRGLLKDALKGTAHGVRVLARDEIFKRAHDGNQMGSRTRTER